MAKTWEISGRAAMITGGGRGIGLDTARRLVARGMRVALVDIDGALAAEEADRLGSEVAIGIAADVTDRDAIEAAVAATVDRFGRLDVVVANAGVPPPAATLRSVDPAVFERTIEVNLLGVWHTVRAGLPQVIEQRGHVLVVASLFAAANGVLSSPYAIAKAGVEQLGRALRVELAPHGATAGVAYFGFIDTGLVREVFASPVFDRAREASPAWLTKPIPVSRAGEAMTSGIERRSARVSAPWWVAPLFAMRGFMGSFDARLARHPSVAAAIKQAESQAAAVGDESLERSGS